MDPEQRLSEEQLEQIKDFLPKWKGLRDLYLRSYFAMDQKYPQWHVHDPRAWVFNKGATVMNSIYLSYAFAEHCMNSPWLEQHLHDPFQMHQYDALLESLNTFIRIGAIQTLMLTVESSFRAIIQEIKGPAYNCAAVAFADIAAMVLGKTGLTNDYGPLCDLLRLTRNTVHNNSVFRPSKGGDKDVPFRGKTYEFRVGQRIRFSNAFFVQELSGWVHEMLEAVMNHPDILALGPMDEG